MKICLFWNETAGGGVSLDRLTSSITRAGHRVTRIVEKDEDLRQHLRDGFDCLAAAGGDGTIARAARALAGGDVPLAILPLGTANNIATSLAIEGKIDQLIDRWTAKNVARIDLGRVDASGAQEYFLESVGFGLVTDTIATARNTIAKDNPDTHLEDARQLYVEMLDRLQPRHYSMRIESDVVAGDYVLVEALNTPLIGPGLNLTPDTNAADGLLSVVAIAAVDRAALSCYLKKLRKGSTDDAAFKSWRTAELEVHGADRMHIDDRIEDVDGPIRIRIAPAALPILT